MRPIPACVLVCAALTFSAGPARAQEVPKPSVSITKPDKPGPSAVIEEMRAQASAVAPLVESPLAKAFLGTADMLRPVAPRLLLRDPQTKEVFTPGQSESLPEPQKSRLTKRIYDTRFYYTTGYGSPIIYARPLDILGERGVESLAGKKVLDF